MPLREIQRSGDLLSGLGAVEALAAVGGTDAVKALAKLASEHLKPEVRRAATEAAVKLAPGAVEVETKAAGMGREQELLVLAATRDRAVLVSALTGKDTELACVAARRLATTGIDIVTGRALLGRMTTGKPIQLATFAAAYLAGARFECPK